MRSIIMVLSAVAICFYFGRKTEPIGSICYLFIDFDETITSRHMWKVLHDSLYLLPQFRWNEEKAREKWHVDGWHIIQEYPAFRYPWEDDQKTHEHIEHLKNTKPFLADVFGGRERIDQLQTFFRNLSEAGVHICIVSYGITREIVAALEGVDLRLDQIHSIFGHSVGTNLLQERWMNGAYTFVPSLNKIERIKVILGNHSLAFSNYAVFVDDDPNMVGEASAIAQLVVIEPTLLVGGMAHEQMQHIVRLFSLQKM